MRHLETREPVPLGQPGDLDPGEAAWLRLDSRVIWLDGLKSLLSLLPTAVSVGIFKVEATSFVIWPVVLTAVLGCGAAVGDLARWFKTRYRLTPEQVELRTGFLVRSHRVVSRERIRSVDATATLLQRLFALRVVSISSGENSGGGKAAFSLDSLSLRAAGRLRSELMSGKVSEPEDSAIAPGRSIARLKGRWFFYNLASTWGLLAAAFVLWSAYWGAGVFNIDLLKVARGIAEHYQWSTTESLLALGLLVLALGTLGLAAGFLNEYWDFQLTRRETEGGTALYSRSGLLRSREVYRDDARLRGVQLSEPLIWRWMGATETSVISTGLSVVAISMEPASTILPRCGWQDAQRVAEEVLEESSPFEQPLVRHPRAALRRRLVWALVTSALLTVLLAWVARASATVPDWAWVLGLLLLPASAGGALVAYGALGHNLVNDYLVFRSGLMSRSTTILRSSAVVSWTVRQSVFQRRLGLANLQVATAAGIGGYSALDVSALNCVSLAAQAGLVGALDAADPPQPARRAPVETALGEEHVDLASELATRTRSARADRSDRSP